MTSATTRMAESNHFTIDDRHGPHKPIGPTSLVRARDVAFDAFAGELDTHERLFRSHTGF